MPKYFVESVFVTLDKSMNAKFMTYLFKEYITKVFQTYFLIWNFCRWIEENLNGFRGTGFLRDALPCNFLKEGDWIRILFFQLIKVAEDFNMLLIHFTIFSEWTSKGLQNSAIFTAIFSQTWTISPRVVSMSYYATIYTILQLKYNTYFSTINNRKLRTILDLRVFILRYYCKRNDITASVAFKLILEQIWFYFSTFAINAHFFCGNANPISISNTFVFSSCRKNMVFLIIISHI